MRSPGVANYWWNFNSRSETRVSNQRFVSIPCGEGKMMLIFNSTICWLFRILYSGATGCWRNQFEKNPTVQLGITVDSVTGWPFVLTALWGKEKENECYLFNKVVVPNTKRFGRSFGTELRVRHTKNAFFVLAKKCWFSCSDTKCLRMFVCTLSRVFGFALGRVRLFLVRCHEYISENLYFMTLTYAIEMSKRRPPGGTRGGRKL